MKKLGYVIAALGAIAIAAPSIASAETIAVKRGHHQFKAARAEAVVMKRGHQWKAARAEFREHRDRGWHEGRRHRDHDRVVIVKHRRHDY